MLLQKSQKNVTFVNGEIYTCKMNSPQVDMLENEIFKLSPRLLERLLKDNTLSVLLWRVEFSCMTGGYTRISTGCRYDEDLLEIAFTKSMIHPCKH